MFASALRLLSSPPSDAAVDFQIRAMGAAVGQLSKRFTRLVGHSPRACSPKIIGRRLDSFQFGAAILCVKRYNSRSIQQVAVHILRVVSSYVRLCAERQTLRRCAASSLRATSAFFHVVGLRGNPHHGIFFSKSPPHKKLALTR